jgi:hypothetical protein
MREAQTAEIQLSDVCPEAVELFLRHVYGEEVVVPLASAPALQWLCQVGGTGGAWHG